MSKSTPLLDAPLAHHYRDWFLEYASYVILDRALPHLGDVFSKLTGRGLN